MSEYICENNVIENSIENEYGENNEYELTEEEKIGVCRAFTLLDTDGDGVLEFADLEKIFNSWGRLLIDDNYTKIAPLSQSVGCGKKLK